MPRSADETRDRLLVAAEQRFGADGILGATFADIISDAGQRNNSAIQYHFGDRVTLPRALTRRGSCSAAPQLHMEPSTGDGIGPGTRRASS